MFWTTWGNCLPIDRSDSLHLLGLFFCCSNRALAPLLLRLEHFPHLSDMLAVWFCLLVSTTPYPLPRRSSSALVAVTISLAKAAVARMVGALSCGIQVLSNLHLTAVLVYARKVGMVQDAADASVGLRILDGIPRSEERMMGWGEGG